MKYDIITGGNERILVTQINAVIAKEKTVKILDAPFAVLDPDSTGSSRLMWCQAILIGETNKPRPVRDRWMEQNDPLN